MAVDEKGNRRILCNSDDNQDSSQGYYNPTIVFPNASQGWNLLTKGETRTLYGNDGGLFKNIRIGFFLIPNGFKTGAITLPASIIHTTHSFNEGAKIDEVENERIVALSKVETETQKKAINDLFDKDYRLGVQSFNARFAQTNLHLIGFEDIKRDEAMRSDEDYNDLLVQLEMNPFIPQDNMMTVIIPSDQILNVDNDGLYVKVPSTILTKIKDSNGDANAENVIFTSEMTFPDVESSTLADRLFSALEWECERKAAYDKEKYTQIYTIKDKDFDDKGKFYVMRSQKQTSDLQKQSLKAVEMNIHSSMEGNSNYSENHKLNYKDVEEVRKNVKAGQEDNPVMFEWFPSHDLDTVASATIHGDPYINVFDGGKKITYKLPGSSRFYRLFKQGNFTINIEIAGMDEEEKIAAYTYEKGHMFRNGSFMAKIFIFSEQGNIFLDRYFNDITPDSVKDKLELGEWSQRCYTMKCEIQGDQRYKRLLKRIGNNVLELRDYESPEVINGVAIYQISKCGVTEGEGLLNSRVNPKYHMVKELTHTKSLKLPASTKEYKFNFMVKEKREWDKGKLEYRRGRTLPGFMKGYIRDNDGKLSKL